MKENVYPHIRDAVPGGRSHLAGNNQSRCKRALMLAVVWLTVTGTESRWEYCSGWCTIGICN